MTSMELATINKPVPGQSLDDLAASANAEHRLVQVATVTVIRHAIATGEILLQAKAKVEASEIGWIVWVEENLDIRLSCVHNYMRLAVYQLEIPDGAETLSAAQRALRGLPAIGKAPRPRNNGGLKTYPPEMREEAAALKDGGLEQKEIAARLGVHPQTVRGWLDPEVAEKRRRTRSRQVVEGRRRIRQGREALRRAERDKAVRESGGRVAEAYSLVRRAAQTLDLAVSEADSRELRGELNTALTRMHQAEDAITKALKIP